MKILILAPPSRQGEKYAKRIKIFLNTLGHESVRVCREARTSVEALCLIGETLATAADCDAVFWDPDLWDWTTGNVIEDVLRRYKMRIYCLKNLATMEVEDGKE